MRDSQYVDAYLDETADPATRYTPWTFLKHTVHGSAWGSWAWSYYHALMRSLARREAAGEIVAVPSKGRSTAYIRTEDQERES